MEKLSVKNADVYAVIVTYHPDLVALDQLIGSLRWQVNSIVIVDNGSPPDCAGWIQEHSKGNVQCILLGKNTGVAGGLNRGIAWAEEHNASHVILLDQDSLPSENMVAELLKAEMMLRAERLRIAAVGPQFFDPRFFTPTAFIRIARGKLERRKCREVNEIVQTDYLITSGSLIAMDAIRHVGQMDDGLFIDYVDIEWGLRAKSKGFYCFGVCAASMRHSLGDQPFTRFRQWRVIPMHSPLRHYYHFRNAVALYRRSGISVWWKINDGLRLLLRFGFYASFGKPRSQQIKMMLVGLWHGFAGRTGPRRHG